MRNKKAIRYVFLTALILSLPTATAYTVLLFSINSAYAQLTVDLNFDVGSPPPFLYQSTPFNYASSSGITAHFRSPMDPAAYSIQNQGTTSYILSTFSGNYLWPSGPYRSPVEIKFSQPLTSIIFSFATMEFHTGHISFINLTAYMDSAATTPIGKTSAQGNWPGEGGIPAGDTYPQGTLTFVSAQPFNLVNIELPFQGAYSASSFLVDNVAVTTADPTGDAVAPVTTLSLSGISGSQGWYTSNVAVTLTAVDNWSGVNKTEYNLDNANWLLYQATFILANEGTTTVYHRSTDNAGNVETTKSQMVKIDKTVPTGSVVINSGDASTTSVSVTLTLTSSDAISGVSEVRYSNGGVWDTELWEPFSTSKVWTLTSGDGAKIVYYQIRDNAGLVSETYQDSITLTTTQPPVDTMKPIANAGPDKTVVEDAIIILDGSASVDNVAITSYTWKFIDAIAKTLTGVKPTYTFATPGVYAVTLNVTDAAGNWATDTVNIQVVDTTDPIADAGQDRTVTVNQLVTFDGSASTDNVGIALYEWDCGDGAVHTEKTVAHVYAVPGTYIVTLTVEDAAGNMANHSITVTVLPAQVAPIQASQLWIILGALAIGIGVTAAVILKRRK